MLTYKNFYSPKRLKELLNSEKWPVAINEELLKPCNQIEQAHTILNMMVGSHLLRETNKLLDFGCGTGKTVQVAPEYGVKNTIGYDIQPAEGVTTNFAEVRSKGPYDIVIVNDVFDHLVNETFQSVIRKIRSVITPESRVFVRCHPYSAKAGTHLPRYGINKAYAHLFFPDLQGEHTNFIPAPVANYRAAFRDNMLYIERELIHREGIENFFKDDEQMWLLLQKRLRSPNFLWDLRVQYAEFTLRELTK